MKTTAKEPGKLAKMLGFLGIGLCALCCALPFVGIIGGAGILATIALHAEKTAVILLILSGSAFGVWYYHKRKAPSCGIDCDCRPATDKTDVHLK